MPHVLNHNLAGGFDFVLAPLVDPSYRPSLAKKDDNGTSVISFASSDLVLNPSQWSSHVVGKLSSWIDLDSDNEELRMDSEIALRQEISWASHLSLQACLLPPHRGGSCGNYARCVNQILQGINNMQLWLRVPLTKSELVGESSDPLMLISGTLVHNISQEIFEVLPIDSDDDHFEGAPVKHSLKPYLEYVAYLYRRIDPLPEQERFELS